MVNRISGLMADLCQNGVTYAPLWQLTSWDKKFNAVDRAKQPRVHKYNHLLASDMRPLVVDGGDVKLLTTNSSDLWTTEDHAGDLLSEGEIIAIPWGGNPNVQYYKGKFLTADNRIAVVDDPSIMDAKFLYYFLLENIAVIGSFYRGSGIKHPSMAHVLDIRVPVPPLNVQREIVNILDTFTRLEVELEAELKARRIQYSYYWNVLLTSASGWRKTTVGDLAEVFDGPHATPKKTESGPWYLSISSLVNGRFDLRQSAHLGLDQYDTWTRRVTPRVGDTMFSYETRLGEAAFWDRDEPAALGRRMGLLRPKEDKVFPKFLTLVYLGPEMQSLIRTKTVRGATVDRIPIADMANWPISIPPIVEQKRIVGILDTFAALVNDQSVGLPAELAARRKQHEHYRGKLMNFKDLAA